MNRFAFATVAAAVVLTTCAAGTAAAAPAVTGSAQDAMNALESNGYSVIVNKIGRGRLAECTVDSVRPGATILGPFDAGIGSVNRIDRQTVYLTAKC